MQFWKHLYATCVFSTLYAFNSIALWNENPNAPFPSFSPSLCFHCYFIFSHNPCQSSAWSCRDDLNTPDVSYQRNKQHNAHLEGRSSAWLWNNTLSPGHCQFYICPLASTQMLRAFSQEKWNVWMSGASEGPWPVCTAASSRGSEDDPSFQAFSPAASQHDSGRENAQLKGV